MSAPTLLSATLPLEALRAPAEGGEWLAVLLSYLLGSIPFGFLMVRFLAGQDLRRIGSGNIGSTNATRVLGKPLGWLVFLLDFVKGWLPVAWIAPGLATPGGDPGWIAVWCAAAAVVGHVFPIWLRFRGGKAVATGMGAVVAFDPLLLMLGGGAWLIVLSATRWVAIASVAMSITFPVVAWQRSSGDAYGREVFWFTVGLAVLILLRHRTNFARLVSGAEPRVGRREEAR